MIGTFIIIWHQSYVIDSFIHKILYVDIMLVMPGSPQQVYEKIEGIKGKKLVLYLIPLFILFVFVGFAIGNLMPGMLGKNEEVIDWEEVEEVQEQESTMYRGKVTYIDPNFYPQDDISYYLEGDDGETLILLKANDEKLTVVEGLVVYVFGEIGEVKGSDEEVLLVEKIVVKN